MKFPFPSFTGRLGRRVSDLPLKRKITLILGISGLGVMGVTIVLLAVFDWAFSSRALRAEYDAMGEVIALNVQAALDFNDSVDAQGMLEANSWNEGLSYSSVLLADGSVFASWGEKPFGVDPELGLRHYTLLRYRERRIEALEPIWLIAPGDDLAARTPDAYVFLVGDLGPILATFVLKTGLLLATLVVVGILVLWMSSRISRLVTVPILDLAETAHRISKDRDFSHRQVKVFNDETGVLVDAFNEMMEQIEERGAIIQSNEERFREYFELGIAGMAILDGAGRFVEANKQLCEMLEMDQEGLLASCYDDWVEAVGGGEAERPFERVRRDCVPGYSDERWVKGAMDKRFFAIVSVRRLTKAVGRHEILYLALFQDISDRKVAEEELLASKQAAEEANRSKDEFLSVMSHELRTPLNPIIGFVDLLMYSEQNEEQLGMLASIRRSSEHLLTLITDILDFTRAQSGRLEPNLEAFDLEELCRGALEMGSRSDASNRIDIRLRRLDQACVPSGVRLFSDAGKIRQIIINFVSNAIKYNKPAGSVWLDAVVEESEHEEVGLSIVVEDSGIGISSEKLDFVFEPFTQLDMSLQRKHEGVGLGLSICKRIAERLGGTISVKSVFGEGSVFKFWIPIQYVADESARETYKRPKLRVVSDEASPSRVLLVEDDLENMRLVEAKLKRMGVGVEWAKNGLVATEKMKESRFDLVLMDVRMPLMDGLEATRVIREAELAASEGRVPIVAMTAHASERMRVECARVGMDGYMSKPIKFDQLETFVKRYLAS